MKLKSLAFEGFGLFKTRQFIDFTMFPENAIIGIFGTNEDAVGYDSNASGKSTLLNTITWCYFDKVPIQSDRDSTIGKIDIINDQCDRVEVTVNFISDIGNDVVFKSVRTRKDSKRLYLEIDGVEWKSNTDSQKREKLFQILGIGGKKKVYFSDFLNHTYFTGETTKGFASKNFSSKDRCSMISRFRKLEIMDYASELSNIDKKKISDEIMLLENNLTVLTNQLSKDFDEKVIKKEMKVIVSTINGVKIKIDVIEQDLKQGEEYNKAQRKVSSLKLELGEIKSRVDAYVNDIEKICWLLNSKKKEFDSNEKLINELSSNKKIETKEVYDIKLKELETQYTEYKVEISTLEKRANELSEKIDHINSGNYLSCPKCKSELLLKENVLSVVNKSKLAQFMLDYKTDMTQIELKIKEINENLSNIVKYRIEIKSKRDKVVETSTRLESLKHNSRVILNIIDTHLTEQEEGVIVKDATGSYSIDKTLKEYSTYSEYTEKLDELNKVINESSHLTESFYKMSDLNEKNNELRILELKLQTMQNQIDMYNKVSNQIFEIQTKVAEKHIKLEMYEYWVNGFKTIKNIELLETEPMLEQITNDFLSKLGTNIEVNYKLDVNNSELDLDLIEDSGVQRVLELFSYGQSNRISLSAGLALRELNRNSNMDFGFTLWDEVLDGLDATGQDRFFDILRDISGLKLVISHDINLKNSFEHRIIVSRKNHISNIKIETN
ncbi:MAG TPA: hypothetical protein VI815_02930 [Candidatus Nanoarchaeia archaeon]|nr:hypothetical protein [Candidatus Nanoarchaeia archaeon]